MITLEDKIMNLKVNVRVIKNRLGLSSVELDLLIEEVERLEQEAKTKEEVFVLWDNLLGKALEMWQEEEEI